MDRSGHLATKCHMCKNSNLRSVLDLGPQPHSDDFLDTTRLSEVEYFYPLRLVSCGKCGLLQIDYFVDPKILYQKNYTYQSSTTKRGREHYRSMAAGVSSRLGDSKGKLAVDIGSNVGVLLQGFQEEGFIVLGVDPAQMIAQIAIDSGIPTIIDFFGYGVAEKILVEHGPVSVITGTNVFAHLHDIDSAVKGMKKLLAPDGIIAIEAPYAVDLIEHLEYDTIYHQHIGYLSVAPMQMYFAAHGLELFDVEPQSIHGGTLRYFVQHPEARPISKRIGEYIQKEKDFGLYDIKRLEAFADAVRTQRQEIIELLIDLKRQGKRIIAMSAPAKGNTLLNYCHIDTTYLDYVTERNPLKVGTYTPGTHIPIKHDDTLLEDSPDYALILAWNFAEEIMKNNEVFSKRGGKFIIPIPKPDVI